MCFHIVYDCLNMFTASEESSLELSFSDAMLFVFDAIYMLVCMYEFSPLPGLTAKERD